jgi:hypothetical protein
MNPNLPRARIKMSDNEVLSSFERLGYSLSIDQIAFTTESVEDFYIARESKWTRVGHVAIYEPPGILVVENAQPDPHQPTRDIVVISLGSARAVMGVLTPNPQAEIPRYAAHMTWG